MKKSQLKQIIKEEVQKLLNESSHEYNIGDKVEYLGYPAEIKGVSDKLGEKLYHIKYLKQGVGLIAVKFVNPNNLQPLNESNFSNYSNKELQAFIQNYPEDKDIDMKSKDFNPNMLNLAKKELHKRTQKLKDLTRTDTTNENSISESNYQNIEQSLENPKTKSLSTSQSLTSFNDFKLNTELERKKGLKENLSIDEKAKIYWMQKLKRGEITTLPKNPKEAWLAQMTKDQMQKDKDQFRSKQGLEESEGEKYFVIRTGGSIGEREFKKEFDSKEEATDYAKRMNKQLSPGEKSYYKIKYSVKKGLNEYEEDEFDRSPQMYSKGKSPRDGRTDFDGTGLVVVGRTSLDNNSIGELMDEPDFGFYGVWNSREGYWFFQEDEENLDELENELQREFNRAGINARFESQF